MTKAERQSAAKAQADRAKESILRAAGSRRSRSERRKANRGGESRVTSPEAKDFVEQVQSTLEDKGLLSRPMSAADVVPAIRQRAESRAGKLNQAPKDIEGRLPSFDGLESIVDKLKDGLEDQIHAIDVVNGAIEKVADNIRKMGELGRVQDIRRNQTLIDAAKDLRKELEGRRVSKSITSPTVNGLAPRQQGLARNAGLTLNNATISITGNARLIGFSPKIPDRMSGIDPDDKRESSHGSGASNDFKANAGGILRGLLGLAAGGMILKTLLSSEQESVLKKELGDLLSGAATHAIRAVTQAATESASEAVSNAFKNHAALSTFGLSGLVEGGARGVGRIAKWSERGLQAVGRAVNTSSMRGTARSVAQGAGKVALASKALPLVGGAIDFSNRFAVQNQSLGQSLAGSMSGTAGSMVGGTIGTGLGMLTGPAAPFVAPVTGAAGAMLGGWVGGKVADGAYRGMNEGEIPNNVTTGQNIPFLNQLGEAPSGSPSEIAYNYYIQKGLTPEQSAGLVGNFVKETGNFRHFVNPDDKTANGKSMGRSLGIAQWNGERLEAFKNRYMTTPDKASLLTQLDFSWHELNTSERGALESLKKTKTAREAALVVEREYERPAKNERGSLDRQNYADVVLRKYQKASLKTNTVEPKFRQMTEENRLIPQSQTPLKGLSEVANELAQTIINMPSVVNAPTQIAAPAKDSSGQSQVLTVRDNNNSFVRNLDRHIGTNFFR